MNYKKIKKLKETKKNIFKEPLNVIKRIKFDKLKKSVNKRYYYSWLFEDDD